MTTADDAPDPPPGRLLLLRHGDTEWSRSGQHTGVTDLPLLPEGEQVARSLAPLLGRYQVVHVRTSPLQRARRTAELAGLQSDAVDEDLREWDYGAFEGRTTKEVREERGRPWSVFTDPIEPGETPGETVEEVAARASRVLAAVTPHRHEGDVVLCGHGHALRILTAVYLEQAPRFAAHLTFHAGAIGVLGHHREDPVIEAWNLSPDPGVEA
ncbi:histidine phosphatase family protein [Ornithinicoccus halotolerans]|uniref:histidine phosphatase family protein n=1 Tax=Ornithinicoccus halotolerans TaxID=1748220 RepID=UPI001297B5DF|nr:histidine phosphatase family protein [Ornithinicoccus halotolerans]